MSNSSQPAIVRTLEFLRLNADRAWSHAELARRIGIPSGTLSGVLASIARSDPRLVKLQRGIYKYASDQSATTASAHPSLVEWLGTDGDGNGIGRSEAGQVYRIIPLLPVGPPRMMRGGPTSKRVSYAGKLPA